MLYRVVQKEAKVKTYIISEDEYMGSGSRMYSVVCRYRELLYHLLDVTNENAIDEDSGEDIRNRPDEFLELLFRDANGDGQPYIMVWCVEDEKQVL